MEYSSIISPRVDALRVEEWVRRAKRGDTRAIEQLLHALDPQCIWSPEEKAAALYALHRTGRAKAEARRALATLAGDPNASGMVIHKWAMTIEQPDRMAALVRADAAFGNAAGKAACALGLYEKLAGRDLVAVHWFRRAQCLGSAGGHYELYLMAKAQRGEVAWEEGVACLAKAVEAEDRYALATQVRHCKNSGDIESALHYADLWFAAARREGEPSLTAALTAARLRLGPDALVGNFLPVNAAPGRDEQQLRDAAFGEETGSLPSLAEAIVLLGRLATSQGLHCDPHLKQQVVALASKGYRPAFAMAQAYGIPFTPVSNALAMWHPVAASRDQEDDQEPDPFATCAHVLTELKRLLHQGAAVADAYWRTILPSAKPEHAKSLECDPAILEVRARVAHNLGQNKVRDALLESWESSIHHAPAWRQDDERERLETARLRYGLHQGVVSINSDAAPRHPAAILARATMLGAVGRPTEALQVLDSLTPEGDRDPAKTALLRAELDWKAGSRAQADTLACYTMIDSTSAAAIDRARAAEVLVRRAGENEIAMHITNFMSAMAVRLVARAWLVARRSSTEVMRATVDHYFRRPHADHYADALVQLIRAQLWTAYCYGERTTFLEQLTVIGNCASALWASGTLQPGALRELLTRGPETWREMCHVVQQEATLDVLERVIVRQPANDPEGFKRAVFSELKPLMGGAVWVCPRRPGVQPRDPRWLMTSPETLELLAGAVACHLPKGHRVNQVTERDAVWYATHAVQAAIGRLQRTLPRIREFLNSSEDVEQSEVVLRRSDAAIQLELRVRIRRVHEIQDSLDNGDHHEAPMHSRLLFNRVEPLIPRGVDRLIKVQLRKWIATGSLSAFESWWDGFRSTDEDIAGVLLALRWQCDCAWIQGHSFGPSGPPMRGVLHQFNNLMAHQPSDENLSAWARLQLHQLRRDRALADVLPTPTSVAADVSALLQDAFPGPRPVPSVPFVQADPALLRHAFREVAENCKKYGEGSPAVEALAEPEGRVSVSICNQRGAGSGAGTQYGLADLQRAFAERGISLVLEETPTTFCVRMAFVEISAGAKAA